MSRNEGALKALLEWITAHLYKDQPEAEASDRALRALCGQLGRNPPYVEAALQITDDGTATVIASAISPSGKVAVVLRQNASDPLSQDLRLITFADGGIKDTSIETYPDNNTNVTTFFPEGSEEPAVVVGNRHLTWGGLSTMHPEYVSCLKLWCDGEERHIAYIVDGTIHHKAVDDGGFTEGKWNLLCDATWLYLVGGSLACLTSKDRKHNVLHWHDWQVQLNTKQLISETEFAPWPEDSNKLIFLCEDDPDGFPYMYVVGAEGIIARHLCRPDNIYFDHGEVFSIGMTAYGRQLRRFAPKGFEAVGQPTSLLDNLDRCGTRVYAFGSTVVLANFETFAGASPHRRVCIITPGHGSSAPHSVNDLALTRLHHGIAVHRRNGTFHWNIPTAADPGTPYADFPLYGLPFDRLTATSDARGKAVMSWGYTDGTLHVLRYPLPSR